MSQAQNIERAVKLARESIELLDAGHTEAASRTLREALSLAPDNSEVQAAFLKVQGEEQNSHPLLELCRRYVLKKDENAGKEAARLLSTEGFRPPEAIASECLSIILGVKPEALSSIQDDIISGLVRHNKSVRQFFAAQLQVSVTTFFDDIYDRGDNAAVCLDTVVLDPTLWPSEEIRFHCESELFQLFIAKLMESGHDLDGRSLKGITRLLAVDAGKLKHLVDDEGFDVILSSLDNRLALDVRGQATLASAKYLEAAKEEGERQFSTLIREKVAKGRNNDLIVAFSAAAALFPVVPAVTSALFLTEGFLPSIVPVVRHGGKSKEVELALLELFNAACIDQACREALSKNCGDWLSHVLTNGDDDCSDLAAVILAKVRASEKDNKQATSRIEEDHGTVHELVDRFKGLMSRPKATHLHNPIEGLAFSSVKADVKEQLAHDRKFLTDLFQTLKSNIDDLPLLYGGMTILDNMTRFPPTLSEEQKKMSELKAYANASKGAADVPPLNDDAHVMKRCDALIDAGVMHVLVETGKTGRKSILELVSRILLSLSKNQRTRGKLAQHGAVKLLLSIANPREGQASSSSDELSHNAAHALARILISVNPSHVFPFSGFPQITSAVRPLTSLITPPESSALSVEQPRDLLPVFESLLALTNLASSPDPSAAEAIVRQAWSVIEDLLLSNNVFIQRAACELICNLMTCESGIVKFADGTSRAGQRLHILLALTDVDDLATRCAAGGALAMLTEYDAAVSAILDRPHGVNLLLNLCQDKSDDLLHRGVVCIRNLTCVASDNLSRRTRDAVKSAGGIAVLKSCLQRTSNPAILQIGVEALKPLIEQAVG